jgi:hypothetical protein
MGGASIQSESYLLSRLVAAGCAAGPTDALLTAIAGDPDGQRMIACLAIDLLSGGIDAQRVIDAAEGCAASGTVGRSEFAHALGGDAVDDFAACISLAGASLAARDNISYASLMRLEKFVYLFRSRDPSTIGSVGAAKEIDFLRTAGRDGTKEDILAKPLRGWWRPITWVTEAARVRAVIEAAASGSDAASQLVEELGLPWEEGTPLHVIVLYYPEGLSAHTNVGQPNSICELWDSPGIFVSAPAGGGWGQTCGRRVASHTGLPERVHDTLTMLPPGYSLRAAYVGQVVLEPLDRSIALAAAESRWNSIAPSSV